MYVTQYPRPHYGWAPRSYVGQVEETPGWKMGLYWGLGISAAVVGLAFAPEIIKLFRGR